MITSEAPPAPKLTRNEGLKSNNTTLAGTIAQTLADPSVDHFTDDDYEFLKFHGVYQQDDRDRRKVARQWIFMVRTKFPGGVLSALECGEAAAFGGRWRRCANVSSEPHRFE